MSEYTYKGEKFTLKKDVLNFNAVTQPLRKELRRLIRESTKHIDRSPILQFEKRLSDLQTKIKRAKGDELEKLSKEIDEVKYLYETNSEVDFIKADEAACIAEATEELFMNMTLARETLPHMIDGKTEIIEFTQTDEFLEFYGKVLKDFFFGRKNGSDTSMKSSSPLTQ